MAKQSTSPVPKKKAPSPLKQMSFFDALKLTLEGKKITRVEWPKGEYGFMEETFLRIHIKGKTHNWTVSEGDMLALDWIVV